VAQLTWETASALAYDFQQSFSKLAPVFLDRSMGRFRLQKSLEKEGSFGQFRIREYTILSFSTDPLNAGYSIRIQTGLNDFNDHFEVFVTDAAKVLLPPLEGRKRRRAVDLQSWQKDFGRSFEQAGCRVLGDAALGWQDLAGLGAGSESA
jgi:hypothetical protein